MKLAWATLSAQYRSVGLRGSVAMAARRLQHRRPSYLELSADLVAGKRGLEIGGPSPIFSENGLVPLYPIIDTLDNCNFAADTIWEGAILEGKTFSYDANREPGKQFILDGADLSAIDPATYDFVLSSHTIEHIADPIRALLEWKRVLRDTGTLILVVPHKDRTFDHRRPVTTLEHLRQDFARAVADGDTTHVEEFIRLYDLRRDPVVESRDDLARRTASIAKNRAIHHHVFTTELVVKLLDEVGFQIFAVDGAWPAHIIALARVPERPSELNNKRFLDTNAPFRKGIFPSDRRPSDAVAR